MKAISLLSGGLDSILATRVVQDQGVDVLALHFITPFFGDDKRGREAEVVGALPRRVRHRDAGGGRLADEYLEVLGSPRYGYGKNFNPCIDCKIFLIRKAAEIMQRGGGALPDHRRGARSAAHEPAPRRHERHQQADRGARHPAPAPVCPAPADHRPGAPRLGGPRASATASPAGTASPRWSWPQRLGITEYPTPAGGCRLTDPILGPRVRRYFEVVPRGEAGPRRDPPAVRGAAVPAARRAAG